MGVGGAGVFCIISVEFITHIVLYPIVVSNFNSLYWHDEYFLQGFWTLLIKSAASKKLVRSNYMLNKLLKKFFQSVSLDPNQDRRYAGKVINRRPTIKKTKKN